MESPSLTKTGLTQRPHYAALDGFRGLLALFVAVYHTIWLSYPNSSAFLNNGAVIIDLFFAFSGFLMFSLYAETLQREGAVRDFMVRRFARLMPMHLFMLGAFVAFALARLLAHEIGLASHEAGEVLPFQPGAVESWRNLLAHLTLTHASGGADQLAFNPPSWTVGAEFWTYALFAVVAAALGRRAWSGWGVWAMIAVITAIYACLFALKPSMDITHDLGWVRCVAGFLVGGLAWRIRDAEGFRVGRPALVEWATVIGATLFTILCAGKGQFLVGPVLLLFVVVFTQDRGPVSRLLSARPFPFLARISYSVYLSHVLIAIAFDIAAGQTVGAVWPEWRVHEGFGTLLLVPYLAVVIGVSALTYRYVEVPGGRWLKRVLSAQPQRTVDALPAAE